MKSRVRFNTFLSFLYLWDKENCTSLVVGNKILFLKNFKNTIKIPINKIKTISIDSKFIFSNIIISAHNQNYKLVNVFSYKVKDIKYFLDFCLNFETIKKEFSLYDSVSNGSKYVSYSYNKSVLKTIQDSILFKFKNLPFDKNKKAKCNKYLECYKQYKNNPEKVRLENNEKFIDIELINNKDFFDNIETNPLTKMQRLAIITDEDNDLIVAGAGSGKTSVIVGKVLYLLKKRLANTNEILVLAFNKKAQTEIEQRLSEKLEIIPDVKTFHGLGNFILRQGKNQKALSKIATDDIAFKNTIKAIIQSNLENDSFAQILKTYFQEYFYPVPNITKFKTEGDYYNYLENFEIRTLNNEKVKSLEECYIANFLYLNGINYEYERTYPYDCGTIDFGIYKPDFYLPDYDIYLEHFAINKNGNTPDFIDRDKYISGIEWKRKVHNLYKTKLIETYSWENYDGILLKNLQEKLSMHDVKFTPINKTEIFKKLNNAHYIDSFTELVSTFLNHYKSNQFKLEDLYDKIVANLSEFMKNKELFKTLSEKRNQAFLNVFESVNTKYEKILQENNENDFNDMILLATKFLEIGFFKSNYKYILVDEFQDISRGRALLLKTLTQNDNTKLFCVGDDWQSIYRFTGSDISLMTHFDKEFGYTKRIDLDMTFRFDDQLNNVASKFITQNENQLVKQINTAKKGTLPSVLIYYEDNECDIVTIVLEEIVKDIQNKEKNKVLILSRFNKLKDKDQTNRENFKNKLDRYRNAFPQLEIEFSSVHGSKGLGFDYVILIDMNRGAFPLEKIDDPILNMVMPQPETYPNAEERRLFYVALTRAKEKIYIIPSSKPSSFIEELEEGDYNIGVYGNAENSHKLKCPKCGTGLLIKSKTQKSFICSHTNYCDYMTPICDNCGKGYIEYSEEHRRFECNNPSCHEVKTKCPLCEDGYLIKRESKFGEFWGCSNYPNCTFTKNINSKFKK